MNQVQLLDGKIFVSGKIDFDSAQHVYQQGLTVLQTVKEWPIVIDLIKTEQGNTLLLAIILQWLKQCPNTESIKIGDMPAKMKGIIEASHLEHLMIV